MPVMEDWTTTPLQIVDNIFENHRESDWEQQVENYFNIKLSSVDAINSIPSLNDIPVHELKPNSLVTFRCMIQDMLDPEFYLGVYEVKDSASEQRSLRCGLYRDVVSTGINVELDPDSPRNVTKDRLSYYCISIPGENQWVKEGYKSQLKCRMGHASTSQTVARPKRPLDNEQMDQLAMMGPVSDNIAPMDVEDNGQTKRIKSNDSVPSTVVGPSYPQVDLNTPFNDPEAIACIVKIYNHSEASSYQINDLVQFVAILAVDPILAHFPKTGLKNPTIEDSESHFMEEGEGNVSPSLVPRLHVIKGLKLVHNNPYLAQDPSSTVMDAMQEAEAKEARICLKHLLENAFFQDSLVAEYVICHLVSSVYLRQDMVTLGKLCLNVSNVPANDQAFGTNLYGLLQNLTAQSHLLPLSLVNATSLTFTPKKDYAANKLRSGVLQLPNRTHLTVDETALTVGQLHSNGVKNIQALKQLIECQKVSYDFNFHQIQFDANVVILVLSQGKSLLPADVHVPMVTEQRDFNPTPDKPSESVITTIRNYLSAVPLLDVKISEDLQQTIQETFVEMRRHDPANVTADDLHLLLVLARLMSLSYGRKTVDKEMWEKTVSLESARKERLRCRRAPSSVF